MPLVLNPQNYTLNEVEISVTNGAIVTKGPLPVAIPANFSGSVIGATFDPAAGIWHVLIATPTS